MRRYEFDLRRTAAYVEISSRAQDARNDRRRLSKQYYYRDELVKIFERLTPKEIIVGLRSLMSNPRIYTELGPEGAHLIEYLLALESLSEEDKVMLHKILGGRPAV